MSISTGIEDLVAAKRTEILRVAHGHGATRVRIFGSIARGESGPESDLDLLVDMDAGHGLFAIVTIKQDIEDLLGREVHVVTEAAISPYIRDEILQEAIPL
jgi:predicted nucleotidyltransferase